MPSFREKRKSRLKWGAMRYGEVTREEVLQVLRGEVSIEVLAECVEEERRDSKAKGFRRGAPLAGGTV